jgi:metallo-beta-lactamase family protein
MAQDTLGRRIVEKNPFVRIFGVEYELNAEVVVINSFSGHADQRELLEFVSGCMVSSPAGGPLKRIFLVHGELEQSEALAGILSQKGLQVHIPDKDEEILLN